MGLPRQSATRAFTAGHPRPKVLLVEDGTISQVLAAQTLKALACEPVVVADGEAAVECTAQETFDLILMDCELPGIDGLEAAQRIRQKLHAGDSAIPPIIALTGNDENEYRQRCLAAGMNGFLAKPVSLSGLGEILRHHLPGYDVACASTSANLPAQQSLDREAATSEPVIDGKALDVIRALQRPGAPNLVAKVVHTFFLHASKLLSDLEQALRDGDAAAVKNAAHDLKSSAATVGASALAARSRRMEALARQNDFLGATQCWAQLALEYDKAHGALSQVSSERER